MKTGELAERTEQADGGDDRGHAEQERDAGGDGRAEGEQQDEQRAAHRELHVARLVGGSLLVEGLALGRGAVLLDEQLGMGLLDGGDGGERGARGLLERLDVLARHPCPGA